MDLQGSFHVYDTTLRDGAQQEGLNLSVADKLTIARQLDELGVGYIEGGWPGANPKDTEFFRRAVQRARPAARPAGGLRCDPARRGGGGRRPAGRGAARLRAPSVVTLVAKSHDRHVTMALRTTLEENLAMIRDTVTHLRAEGQTVFLDAEHFFDGYRDNRDYALEVLRTAYDAGAEVIALCDTNGGMLPGWVGRRGPRRASTPPGSGSASTATTTPAARSPTPWPPSTPAPPTSRARSTATASAPATPTWSSVVANLELKLDRQVLPQGMLQDATRIAHAVAEVTNVPPASRQPYVGTSRRSPTRPGLHASAIKVDPNLYQHLDPVRGRATTCGCWSPTWPVAPRSSSRAASSGSTCPATRSWSPGSPTGSRRWSSAATPSRRPTPPSSCCCSRRSRAGGRRTSTSSRGG